MTLGKKTFQKIVGKGEKCWQLAFFFCFFFRKISIPFKTNFATEATYQLPSANTFSLDKSKILAFGLKKVIFIKRQNYGLLQIEWICARHINSLTLLVISEFDKIANIVSKEKILASSNFSYSNHIFKGSFQRVVKRRDFVVKD